MELMKTALAALHAAEARFHELLNPVEHLAERTRDLAKATAQTVEASIEGLSTRLESAEGRLTALAMAYESQAQQLEQMVAAGFTHLTAGAAAQRSPQPTQEKPSATVPDSAPAAAVPQDAKPAAEVSATGEPAAGS